MSGSVAVDGAELEQTLATLLEDGVFIDGDWVESKDQDPNGEVRLIQLADVGDGVFRNRSSRFLTVAKAKDLRCTFLQPGDVLVARMPEPLGRACIFPGVGQPAVTVVDVCILRPNPERARPEWLVKAVNSPTFRSAMQEFVRGTTRQRISRTNLGLLTLTVPLVEFQLSLARLVDEVDFKRDTAARHIGVAAHAVERFRQAILAAGCSGRLTSEWREAHDLPSARITLDRLRAGRSTGAQRRTSVQPPDSDSLDAIPETWGWAAIGEVAEIQIGGTPSRKTAAYWGGGVPWVSSGEVANCRISRTRETISRTGLVNSSAKMYPAGTVLIAMIGEGKTRGQSAILDIEASTNQNVAGILPDASVVMPEYVWCWALAQYEITRAVGRGGNQPALNGQKVRELAIPVPPLDEQHEIVRRVGRFLAAADTLHVRINTAGRKVDLSSQAVLAKAFGSGLLTLHGKASDHA